jgi:hypothetical protein
MARPAGMVVSVQVEVVSVQIEIAAGGVQIPQQHGQIDRPLP